MDNTPSPEAAGVLAFYHQISTLQQQIVESQLDVLTTVAAQMADIVRRGERIFSFGTGHSHMLCEESFYRAGGIAAAVPMLRPSVLMLHESPRMSSQVERMPELAVAVLDEYDPRPGEMLIVYTGSGVNGLPIQMAIEARRRGLVVVGVCSLKYAAVAPLSPVGKRLPEVVDYVIDNFGEPGDALLELEGSPWRVTASSTIAGALIWNCLLAGAAFRLNTEGANLPIFASFNMPGAADHNAGILEKWSRVNPHLPSRNLQVPPQATE
jgi:uncharacterized phosphosugar-binding protein